MLARRDGQPVERLRGGFPEWCSIKLEAHLDRAPIGSVPEHVEGRLALRGPGEFLRRIVALRTCHLDAGAASENGEDGSGGGSTDKHHSVTFIRGARDGAERRGHAFPAESG